VDHYVMDAGGLIAYLRKESGYDLVQTRLEMAQQGQEVIWMHVVNLCEVYYDVYRRGGKGMADQLLRDVYRLPIRFIQTISRSLLQEAGRLKANGGISLADAFAVALANLNNAKLITADHHELDIVETRGDGRFYWFR